MNMRVTQIQYMSVTHFLNKALIYRENYMKKLEALFNFKTSFTIG